MSEPWITVIETPAYLASSSLTEQQRRDVVTLVARDPECGEIVPDTGGIRKVRIPLGSRGKRGGGRVIYFFFNAEFPVYLLASFAKNEKADLSMKEKAALASEVAAMKRDLRARKANKNG